MKKMIFLYTIIFSNLFTKEQLFNFKEISDFSFLIFEIDGKVNNVLPETIKNQILNILKKHLSIEQTCDDMTLQILHNAYFIRFNNKIARYCINEKNETNISYIWHDARSNVAILSIYKNSQPGKEITKIIENLK